DRVASQALGIICRYDEFHDRMLVGGHQIGQWAGELSDAVTVVLRQVIIEKFGFDPGKDHVADAATALCLENRFDPLLDYLDCLKWDGVPRLDRWLTTYLGVEDADLHRAVFRATLIAAVRRIRQPGCKFDHILTLEGPEGKGKSTAIAVLAGVENFSDQTILSQSDKEQQELLRGIWLYEIADLAGLRRAEVEKVKAFASRTHDRARPAYGRRRVDAPRRCIFVATTNEDEYLKSPTGNRRFWPVAVGSIDIEGLRRDRDQTMGRSGQSRVRRGGDHARRRAMGHRGGCTGGAAGARPVGWSARGRRRRRLHLGRRHGRGGADFHRGALQDAFGDSGDRESHHGTPPAFEARHAAPRLAWAKVHRFRRQGPKAGLLQDRSRCGEVLEVSDLSALSAYSA